MHEIFFSILYGDEWSFDAVEKVELLNKMPPVTSKVDSFDCQDQRFVKKLTINL
jgi:hypothetical protein